MLRMMAGRVQLGKRHIFWGPLAHYTPSPVQNCWTTPAIKHKGLMIHPLGSPPAASNCVKINSWTVSATLPTNRCIALTLQNCRKLILTTKLKISEPILHHFIKPSTQTETKQNFSLSACRLQVAQPINTRTQILTCRRKTTEVVMVFVHRMTLYSSDVQTSAAGETQALAIRLPCLAKLSGQVEPY